MAWRRLALIHLSSSSSSRLSIPPSSQKQWITTTATPHLARRAELFGQLGGERMRGMKGDCKRWFCAGNEEKVGEGGGEVVEVELAQTGEGIAECELLKWFVQEGDEVEEFQRLCEVQSDKATIEITSRFKGKIHQIHFIPGDIIKVGETLLKILTETTPQNQTPEIPKPSTPQNTETTLLKSSEPSRTLATPSIRQLARDYGVDINEIKGSGKEGRVLKEDVLRFGGIQGGICKNTDDYSDSDDSDDDDDYEDKVLPLRGFQRAMVKSMGQAAKVPHFHFLEEINCDNLVDLKNKFQMENKDQSVKHTFLPFLIKSLSLALTKFPLMNSSFIEENNEVILKGCHNIGVAMATDYGLVVPNIKKVQSLSILEITKELSRLHDSASKNKLNTIDISQGTITLSNIGAIGGKFGSPLLNLPEVSIIALGRIQKLPRYDKDGNLYPASVINVTIGADHRVVDGATVARFCNEWKNLIEKPELLLLHMR